jgi:hypothetical protein
VERLRKSFRIRGGECKARAAKQEEVSTKFYITHNHRFEISNRFSAANIVHMVSLVFSLLIPVLPRDRKNEHLLQNLVQNSSSEGREQHRHRERMRDRVNAVKQKLSIGATTYRQSCTRDLGSMFSRGIASVHDVHCGFLRFPRRVLQPSLRKS